ncbi:hypothetical protein ACQKRQ_38330 [Paraburkholderia sp. NPDC080076]|uniref:hypothetical protein n=1 Tax=Paraburkholderia sp. NPDC080076 TaxID=3390605 RepID=UPI003CFEDDAA
MRHRFTCALRAPSLAALGITLCIGACTTPYKSPVYDSSLTNYPEAIAFPGIISKLSEHKALDVLLVHGMCTHDGAWANKAANALYQALGGAPDDVPLTQSTVNDTDVQLYQRTFDTKFGTLKLNAIVWSRMTTPLKAQLCFDQTARLTTQQNANAYCVSPDLTAPYPYRRDAALNRILKDSILDDCLADAVIYEGRSRDEMSAQMQKAILQALATSGGNEIERGDVKSLASQLEHEGLPDLVVITDSLGSKIAFDALWKLSNDTVTAKATRATLQRITQIFMRANQLPILALADVQIPQKLTAKSTPQARQSLMAQQGESEPTHYPSDPLGALFGANKAVANERPNVVAFTDPNDLLSYVLVPSMNRQSMNYEVVDVVTSNSPTYFGAIERPDYAHLDYDTNKSVIDSIVCGNPKSALCDGR